MRFFKSINQICPQCGAHLDEGDTVICPPMSSEIIACGQCVTDEQAEAGNFHYTGKEWKEEFNSYI